MTQTRQVHRLPQLCCTANHKFVTPNTYAANPSCFRCTWQAIIIDLQIDMATGIALGIEFIQYQTHEEVKLCVSVLMERNLV